MDSADYVKILITTNTNSMEVEKRFPLNITIRSLKDKLELITGSMGSSMLLELKNCDNEPMNKLMDDTLTLGQCGVCEGMKIHVIDTSGTADGDLAEEGNVAFELSPEEYAKRDESARSFLMKNKLGRFDDEKIKKKAEDEENQNRIAETLQVDKRCQVRVQGQPTKRGEVKYIGKVHFKEGAWVGVQYDEPLGKNDGSIDGKRYFECKLNYGAFVRPSNVEIGDFPELGIEDDVDEI